MPLSVAALSPLPMIALPVPLTCHVAVWFWAAQEAQARGLTEAKAPQSTLQRIVAMPGGPQTAMMALPATGLLQLTAAALPPPGSVLRWSSGATHSAVVTGADAIAGYNQAQQFPGAGIGRTVRRRLDVHPGHGTAAVLLETTVVTAAGLVFNL